ncbi:unnamed protein product [Candidula unifasciata]|uniref:Transcription initiation factor IIA subunit 2 n=1 Tax=Candidula unifasciata TaxID=100452 RepID=A0A8S4A4U1_9EUPU|nr:unnamed protein product [Candidula unifasciata]
MGQISPRLALLVLQQFDKSVSEALSQRVTAKVTFKAKLNTYRFCDNVWTFVLHNAEFRETPVQEIATVNKLKVVACDGKGPANVKQV